MTTLGRLMPGAVQGLHLEPFKSAGTWRKPLGARARANLVRSLHDPTPKKWELRTPKGIKHDLAKPKRLEAIQKALKSVERQMPDRLKKHPKREERAGHQWFKPAFEEDALKYFRKKSVASMTPAKIAKLELPISTIMEYTLELARKAGHPDIPPADRNKLLIKLQSKGAASKKKDDGGKEKKKKAKK